mmetsp:Transcript_15012/g.42619  ORF Transcript_15012/g.42619 Transcript_15012/m.42619 type:complete len:210 (+) Transcript_15012:650-1279(+)
MTRSPRARPTRSASSASRNRRPGVASLNKMSPSGDDAGALSSRRRPWPERRWQYRFAPSARASSCGVGAISWRHAAQPWMYTTANSVGRRRPRVAQVTLFAAPSVVGFVSRTKASTSSHVNGGSSSARASAAAGATGSTASTRRRPTRRRISRATKSVDIAPAATRAWRLVWSIVPVSGAARSWLQLLSASVFGLLCVGSGVFLNFKIG